MGRRRREQSFRIGGRRTGFRRQFGFDRSGPPPRQTRPGQPLRPWTIPNAVGYLRLAGLPVFLYLAFSSGDGRSPAAAAIFWLIAVGDYVDGFLARATGQYSRMGAILDPVVDRLTILCGVAVCWHFELLPRWALAVLAVREVVTALIAQVALRRLGELQVNWLGRIAIWPTTAAIFFSMISESPVWDAMLIFGVVLGVLGTIAYIRTGIRELATA
jgi:CDP-diacylglycerol--glycerol-3-phosphate 3-phosphatidyltransferase